MAITVNTNIASIVAQRSLNNATNSMNTAMERMTTGLKINSSKDDAAGLSVATKMNYQISSLSVAQNNGQTGASMLDTTEGVLGVIQSNLQRVRDLTEQAANGTHATDAMNAIKIEVQARMDEVTRVSKSSDFNGKTLLNGSIDKDINLQVGIKNDLTSTIQLKKALFADAAASTLFNVVGGDFSSKYVSDTTARAFLTDIDKAIENIASRKTEIGGSQQRILSAVETANVMEQNLTSAVSLIQDADIAKESSSYIKSQILQQSSATLLATANQAPSIALNLV